MYKGIFQESGYNAINTTAEEEQCNIQMLPPTMKQCGYKSLKSPNCLNYYDDLFSVLTEMKEEFPEDECRQTSTAASCINKCGIDSNIVIETEELSKVPETQEIKQEASEEALSLIKTEEINDEMVKFIAETEMSEESRILSNTGDTSVLYKGQATPHEIQPTMCGGILKNGFNLLTHNNEHIKIKPPTLVSNEGNESHKCHCRDEHVNHDTMLANVDDVHSHKKEKSKIYHESIKKIRAGTNVDEINYKCDFCKRTYKSKSDLVSHLKKIHYRFGRIFECWCGKQFPTLIQLNKHKRQQHNANVKITNNAALKVEFQCDICKKMFRYKSHLKTHITSTHNYYSKTFNCWCGKQFRTPIYLRKHKKRLHYANIKRTNNTALKAEFQCDICKKMLKSKDNLKRHITSVHYDHGITFECWCGKQFRRLNTLYTHKSRHNAANAKSTNNAALKPEFQCDICKKMYKSKFNLKSHIISIHYDYGKAFECWCGKQFRTPIHLCKHKYKQHGANVKTTNDAALKTKFQCDICKKMFKSKGDLIKHITSIHCDYDKAFRCWCGKQFRTSIYLFKHKNRQHDVNIKSTNNTALKTQFQCDVCKKMFKWKCSLRQHILRIHCDYAKTFECWCGKQFRTPMHLYQHKNRQHHDNIKSTNNAACKTEFKCDICKKMFKSKDCLRKHITNIH